MSLLALPMCTGMHAAGSPAACTHVCTCRHIHVCSPISSTGFRESPLFRYSHLFLSTGKGKSIWDSSRGGGSKKNQSRSLAVRWWSFTFVIGMNRSVWRSSCHPSHQSAELAQMFWLSVPLLKFQGPNPSFPLLNPRKMQKSSFSPSKQSCLLVDFGGSTNVADMVDVHIRDSPHPTDLTTWTDVTGTVQGEKQRAVTGKWLAPSDTTGQSKGRSPEDLSLCCWSLLCLRRD